MFFREFPSVSNGTCRLVMSFCDSIPSSVSVADFSVRVFHAGQPVICSICHESVHQPLACPFSSTVTLPVSTISAPVLSVPPTTVPAPVSRYRCVDTCFNVYLHLRQSFLSRFLCCLIPLVLHHLGLLHLLASLALLLPLLPWFLRILRGCLVY